MNAAEKKVFISDLMGKIEQELLANVAKMPADWDGIELRQLVADKAIEASYVWARQPRKRKKDYLNNKAILNL